MVNMANVTPLGRYGRFYKYRGKNGVTVFWGTQYSGGRYWDVLQYIYMFYSIYIYMYPGTNAFAVNYMLYSSECIFENIKDTAILDQRPCRYLLQLISDS